MRLLSITSLLSILISGCSFWGETQNNTHALNTSDLSIRHHYKIPQKIKSMQHLKQLHDPQLNQLISIALADSPDMRSAKSRVRSAQQQAKGAYASLWPSINLSGYLQKQYFPVQGTIPPPFNGIDINQVSVADLALKFHYEMDFWGKNRENLASKLSESYALEMDLAETRLILSTAVATTYFDLQNNIVQQHLAKENAQLQKQLADIILDRAKQGIESDIPVKTALSNVQTALLSLEDYKRAELQARHQLAVLLGKNPFNTEIDTGTFTYSEKLLVLPEIIPANILAQRPDIASARALAEAAAHQVKVAQSAFFPNINLKSLLSVQSLYFSKLFNISLQNDGVTAALDLPVFDAGTRRANLGVSYAAYDLAISQYNQTILNSLKQVTDQLATLQTLQSQIHEQNKALMNTQSNYKLFQSRYTQGIIDYTQLIEIKQLLLKQKAILVNLQTHQIQAFVALLAALGGEI